MSYRDWPLRIFNDLKGQTYATLDNPKLCIHTTETLGLPNYEWPPHITYDIDNDRGWQHVDPSKGSYALRSPGGGKSPNYQAGPVFQIEVVSYARDSPRKSDLWYERLGALIAEVCVDLGIPRSVHPKGFTGSVAYGLDGVNRLTWNEFTAFTGILGHQHVPFNTHWDPGNLDELRLGVAIALDIGDDMPLTDEDISKIWSAGFGRDDRRKTAGQLLVEANATSAAALAIVKEIAEGRTLSDVDIDRIIAEQAESFGLIERD